MKVLHKSPVVKRSVTINNHKTSVSLEVQFWDKMKAIARQRHCTLGQVVDEIDTRREAGNLSSAIRLYVLEWAINGGDHANPNPLAADQRRTAPA